MAEMEDFDETLLLMDLVVNENRAVDQLPDSRPLASAVPHARETARQFDVIEQGLAKTRSGLAVLLSDLPHDLGQIV